MKGRIPAITSKGDMKGRIPAITSRGDMRGKLPAAAFNERGDMKGDLPATAFNERGDMQDKLPAAAKATGNANGIMAAVASTTASKGRGETRGMLTVATASRKGG